MKLEVGMYVRTETGHIDKIIKIDNKSLNGRTIQVKKGELDYCMGYEVFTDLFGPSHYTKASFNIIDLIEEGDYVNGLRVEKNKYGELYISYVYYGGDIGKQCEVYTNWLKELKEGLIYNIVTREQFASICYELLI